ncbi:Peptide methionine sulfoxide reductase B5 [Bonamia ostreae]|uniref:Peptide-methionine (R)-S-oxide reductase n=1 Tax=Bonamia ostreae TaxID=126728 RepID=A0ABV2AFW7_9EUKA
MAKKQTTKHWKAILSPNQFKILRLKQTEKPFTGQYLKHEEDGVYNCAGCNSPLYKSSTKFDSGCGWPAFYEGVKGAIETRPDKDGKRVEIVCGQCEGHLGHVFKNEGFDVPTNVRHCVNSASLLFEPTDKSLV